MEERDDIGVVQECLQGNQDAYALLVEKYRGVIFNIIFKMLNDYEGAQDVTQGVFVKAFEKLGTYDRRYKFFSWLYRIAINESLNFLKGRKSGASLHEVEELSGTSPYEAYEKEEKSKHVESALMDLDPQYRVLILLRYFQNLSYSEISDIVEIPEKTVKSRLFTARLQLRDILTRKGTAL